VLAGLVAAVAALVVGAVVLLGGGGGDDEAQGPVQPGTSSSVPGTSEVPDAAPVAPLTGLALTDVTAGGRPALVVKVDNADALSRPQAGLNQADVVYEEKVEGPVSRFAAVFHSRDADPVAPVRSGRSTDVALVGPLNVPLYAFSGANAVFLAELRAAPLVDVGYDVHPEAYDRDPQRTAPDDLTTTTARLWDLAPVGAAPPAPLFAYATGGAPPSAAGGAPTTSLAYGWGRGGAPVSYGWDAVRGLWLRTQNGTPHVDAAGEQLGSENVIVQFVTYVDTGLVDVAGTPVPEAQLVGQGTAWVLSDGASVEAAWAKPDDTTPTAFTTVDGASVLLTPGRTWVILVPVGGDATLQLGDGTTRTP
jgi:hypothetical protein